jgi:hypothetical protein
MNFEIGQVTVIDLVASRSWKLLNFFEVRSPVCHEFTYVYVWNALETSRKRSPVLIRAL